ncbi:hypothetical protein M2282_001904 [Variovorax boronicumulans]|uniref:hypothetical protein n=1 Tax=Variovorax boronicumulans TaxID=436515 RepID=UPI00247370B5|nr:hypothetical protein [Variovorax boronicumulans]MDH6166757.1 hypothetical protein [Variovorax boronicumulans]
MSAPVFSQRIQVTQPDASGIWPILLLCAAYTALIFVGAAWLIDPDATGWYIALGMVAMIGLFAAWLVGLVFVVRAWIWVETHWLRLAKSRPKLFNEKTLVDIGEEGFSVQGLGCVEWIDVLSLEGIPDSDNYLIVHTRPFKKLMLTAPVDELVPVFNHYLAQRSNAGAMPKGILQSRAMLFCWRCFLAWVWAGYALAGAAGIAMLLHAPDVGFLKTVVALCVLLPMIAWLVWAIPFSRISTFSHSRVRAFQLDNTQLRSIDGDWQIDLRQARVSHRRAKGLGYEFDFLAIRPKAGKSLDLLLEGGADQEALLDALSERGLLPHENPER